MGLYTVYTSKNNLKQLDIDWSQVCFSIKHIFHDESKKTIYSSKFLPKFQIQHTWNQ